MKKKTLLVILCLAFVLTAVVPVSANEQSPAASMAAEQQDTESIFKQVQVGETEKLWVTGWNYKVTWESSDAAVAIVTAKGVVKGICPGEATITATAIRIWDVWGKKHPVKTEFKISVVEKKDAPVFEEKQINVGESISLTISGRNKKIIWKSSDQSIATVSRKGIVEAITPGTVKITAKAYRTWNFLLKKAPVVTEFTIVVIPDIKIHTVTFETNGGSKISKQSVENSDLANRPTDPTKEGYSFDGWYADEELESEYDFATAVIEDITLYAKWSKDKYTVSFDLNYETTENSPETQEIKAGEYAVEPTVPNREDHVFSGWHLEQSPEDFTANFDFQNTQITDDIMLYACWISMLDSDGDGLVNDVENYYKTNINKRDTDNDTLSDYVEVVILGTDPLSAVGEDDINDADRDSDEDGLINSNEIKIGTNPGDSDTDGDRLNDGKEDELGTDPLNYDTDTDGVSDGVEVELGTNPLITNEVFDISSEFDNGDKVIPSVEINLSGEQVETLAVEPINDTNLFPEDMPGYMGKAYEFSVDGQFDKATISFEFDATALSSGAEPTIFCFNESTQSLEEIKTEIINNKASAAVEHFSTYILINRVVYYSSFQWEDVWDTENHYSGVEVVLVIDDSGSMDDNDTNNERLKVAQDLLNKLPDNSKIGIVRFANDVDKLTSELILDKEVAKAYLTTDNFKSSGGTKMYSAINGGCSLFQSSEEGILKMLVVLSDGVTSDTSKHSSTVTSAQNNNVHIYTVGLGSSTSYFNNYLKPLAENTGGMFYLADNAGELASIFENINKKIDLETDSDEDGIPDYYEDHMISFSGKKVSLDKNMKDTDGDKLDDNEEVEVELVYNEDKTKVYVKGKLISYPDLADSDSDSINDDIDPKPMEYTITDRTLSFVEGLSYTNLNAYVGKTVGEAIDAGVNLSGISKENAEYLRNAIIVGANNSGIGYWKDFWDGGLGSLALKFVRKTEPSAVIYSLRGTEFKDDPINDVTADVTLALSWDTLQSKAAFSEYKRIAYNKNFDYYVTGHSLGGRLAQDVIYKIFNANKGGIFRAKANIPTPVHSATFNALGYNSKIYITLNPGVLNNYKSLLTNYYYPNDMIGVGTGCSGVFKRAGTDVKLSCKKIDGAQYPIKSYYNIDYHSIEFFQNDYDLLYSSNHDFVYWTK